MPSPARALWYVVGGGLIGAACTREPSGQSSAPSGSLASSAAPRPPESAAGPGGEAAILGPRAAGGSIAVDPSASASGLAAAEASAVAVRPPSPPAIAAFAHAPPSSSAAGAWQGPVDRARDGEWITRLAGAPITRYERHRGGATLTIKVAFGDGSRALLKVDQTHSASNFRGEIAAYHLDRLLGLGRTAVVVGRRFDRARLRAALAASGADEPWLTRFDREVRSDGALVAGALIAWHAERLVGAEPPRGWTRPLRGSADAGAPPTSDAGASRPSDAGASRASDAAPQRDGGAPGATDAGASRDGHAATSGSADAVSEASIPPARRWAEWSDLVLFDALIDNTDRWSGGNVLAWSSGPLIFLDNAASFQASGPNSGERSFAWVAQLCRFRRATVLALEAYVAAGEHALGGALATSLLRDPTAPVLSRPQLDALDRRAARVAAHLARCIESEGRERVLALE